MSRGPATQGRKKREAASKDAVRPALLLIPAAVLGSAAMACAMFASWQMAAGLTVATLACAAWVARGAASIAAAQQAARDAEEDDAIDGGRSARRDIFAGDPSVYADWYFARRLGDELGRASRAGMTLCVLKITSRSTSALDAGRRAAREWLGETGFAGRVRGGVAIVLIGGTRDEGREFATRVQRLVRGLRVDVREFPADGASFRDLLGEDAPAEEAAA